VLEWFDVEVESLYFIFANWDLHFRRLVKLGTHAACLLKYLLSRGKEKRERRQWRRKEQPFSYAFL